MVRYASEDKKFLALADRAFERGDRKTALKYYLKAAEMGIVVAMVNCGCIYFEGEGVEEDIDEALNWFHKAAEYGDATAANNIGYIYSSLDDYKEAVIWYEKAANLGDVVSMLNLSNLYRYKFYNKKKADYWLKKAESLNDTESIRRVADYYYSSENIVKNHTDKAIDLYKKAISLGDTEAYKELGDLYFAIEDFVNAHNTYRDGANADNVDCMFELGTMLIYAPNCFIPAQFWLKKAVLCGNKLAIKSLGELYERHKDYPKAMRCYRKAILNGVDASESLQKVKKLFRKSKPNYKLKLRTITE